MSASHRAFSPAHRWAGAAMLLIVVFAGVSCGEKSDSLGPTPGFHGDGRPVDTRPFQLAEPSGREGSTTLPDSVFDPTLTNTTIPTVSTTTTLPELDPPPLDQITSICGFELVIAPFERLPQKTPAQTKEIMLYAPLIIDRYAEVAPDQAKEDLRKLSVAFTSVVDVLSQNGWDTRSAAYITVVQTMGATSDEPGTIDALLGRIVAIEKQTCR